MFAPKVSIIVPVYNLENYIENCVQSLLNQAYQNIEIIIVDDGSSDSSLSIIERLASDDSRIVYRSQPNGGAAKARNTGLSLVTGDYITFVDGDDMLSPNAISDNIGYFADEKIDWVAFSIKRIDSNGNNIQAKGIYPDFIICEYEELASDLFVPYFYRWKLSGVACGAIYRKKTIQDIRYEEGVYYEDSIYFIDLICRSKCGVLSPKGEYLYVDRADSLQKALLDYKHLESSLYILKKKLFLYREFFPMYESYYLENETVFYYFLRNEIAKGNIEAEKVLLLFMNEIKPNIRKSIRKEIKLALYRIIGYNRIKKILISLGIH